MGITALVSIEHPRLQDLTGQNACLIEVEFDRTSPDLDGDALVWLAEAAAAKARRLAVAAHLVDLHAFGSGVDYLNEIDRIADETTISDIDFASPQHGEAVGWAVGGSHDDFGGRWSDHVTAPTAGIASFKAMWKIKKADPTNSLTWDTIFDEMSEMLVDECEPAQIPGSTPR